MKRPAFAWITFALTAACLIAAALLPDEDWPLDTIVMLGAVLLFTSACGALIASRRSDNAIGWILIAIALSIASGLLATQWANRALVDRPGSLPGGVAAAWLQSWLWIPLTGLFPLLVLLFPTGRLASRRWRPVAWVVLAAIVLPLVNTAFRPGGFDTFPKVTNPLGVGFVPGDLLAWLAAAWIVTVPASLLSVFMRFRQARGVERQQIKWFFFAAASAVVLVVSNPVLFALYGGRDPTILGVSTGFIFPVLAFALLPSAIGLAVLRYRLYDIDRIISRTFSYAIVTAILGGLFALFVVIPSLALGSREVPDYVIAAATLVVAALFRPVRGRVQAIVDRRFNRARYDAEYTIESFTLRLREQIDIDALGAELCAVVNTTVQPSRVALWLTSRP